MRLIDADALGAEFNSRMLDGVQSFDTRNVIKFIRAQPTVDAVQVVRCKDCIWYEKHPVGDVCVTSCGHDDGLCYESTSDKSDGYWCCFGKRKDGAE